MEIISNIGSYIASFFYTKPPRRDYLEAELIFAVKEADKTKSALNTLITNGHRCTRCVINTKYSGSVMQFAWCGNEVCNASGNGENVNMEPFCETTIMVLDMDDESICIR
jgi:hypothetical protein